MTFRELLEAKTITIYHGDNYNTTKLDPKLMNNGNNQEGIGIYFSNIETTAKSYGKNVVSVEVNESKLIPSRGYIGDEIGVTKIAKILSDMHKVDNEAMYYFITDWIEIYEPEDIEEYHFREMAENISSDQVRDFQVTLAEKFGVEEFVKSWLKHTKIDGTFHQQTQDEIWYAIINPKIKVTKI